MHMIQALTHEHKCAVKYCAAKTLAICESGPLYLHACHASRFAYMVGSISESESGIFTVVPTAAECGSWHMSVSMALLLFVCRSRPDDSNLLLI